MSVLAWLDRLGRVAAADGAGRLGHQSGWTENDFEYTLGFAAGAVN